MGYDFTDKVALVTGGTRGIGRACVAAFAHAGAAVAFCGRDSVLIEEVQNAYPGTRGYAVDMSDLDAVGKWVEQAAADCGTPDILVNNAGVTRDGLILRMKDEAWREVLDVNLSGAFATCRAAARMMLRNRRGRIINISSIVGLRGQAGQTNYAAAKAGLIGFSKALAQELASRSITVNVVAPGYIVTNMTSGLSQDAIQNLTARIPLGRAGAPEEVAQSVLFLASDDAAYITGTVLSVDGGLGM
jgi:3-oxoacyl-[acyl-carrier protein] reductase